MPSTRAGDPQDPRGFSIEDPRAGRPSILRNRAPWLLRRGWVVLLCLVIVLMVAVMVGQRKQVTYSAAATLSVSTGVSATQPGDAYGAQTQAANYAGLIHADTPILDRVAKATDLNRSEVASATAATVQNGTSLLTITFTASTPERALIGATAMADAVAGKHPADPKNFPTGAVVVTQFPTDVTRHAVKLPVVVGIGVILGLLLGVVLLIAWERADARFDQSGQVTTTLGVPARALASLTTMSAVALLDRWRIMIGRRPARVALVPAVSGITNETLELVRRLGLVGHFSPFAIETSLELYGTGGASAFEPGARREMLEESPPTSGQGAPTSDNGASATSTNGVSRDPGGDVLLMASGAPGYEGGEATAQHADLTVLVVPRGSRVREVQQSAILLDQVGVRPEWALMVDLNRLRVPTTVHQQARSGAEAHFPAAQGPARLRAAGSGADLGD